jgi:hypothetical protein
MNDIDPFKVPPLVEWENCITKNELFTVIRNLQTVDKKTSWIHLIPRLKLKWTITVLVAIIDWINDGKPIYQLKNIKKECV